MRLTGTFLRGFSPVSSRSAGSVFLAGFFLIAALMAGLAAAAFSSLEAKVGSSSAALFSFSFFAGSFFNDFLDFDFRLNGLSFFRGSRRLIPIRRGLR